MVRIRQHHDLGVGDIFLFWDLMRSTVHNDGYRFCFVFFGRSQHIVSSDGLRRRPGCVPEMRLTSYAEPASPADIETVDVRTSESSRIVHSERNARIELEPICRLPQS